MEKLANKIAKRTAEELKFDEEKREVMAYGTLAIIQIIITVILVTFFGFIFKVALEALIICFSVSTLRKYSGGAHATSINTCTIMSTFICIGQALLFKYAFTRILNIYIVTILGCIVFLWSYYIMYKLAPVDSPRKPIKKKEKIIKMKKGSIFVISLYLILVIINVFTFITIRENKFLVYSLCLYGGVAWQTFTLTKVGHKIIKKIDSFLIKNI